MFNAFKKLTGRSDGSNNGSGSGLQSAPPPGLTTMSMSLQKKFAKGVHYNMKIILKGDRNVGKSQLFRRLQGLAFVEEYTATEEIQVANITWNYKTSDDIVKVEIWDIVDVANKKKKMPSDKLKLENSIGLEQENGEGGGHEFALDANTIDVYKNTNGVILVFDLTKSWTYDYVQREMHNVPEHIPILILGNRRDMGHHRVIASDTVTYFIEGLVERPSSTEIKYTESSMRNGFGLKYIHKFFNLPYLHLQREKLLKQLEVNREETEITLTELDYYADGDEANYDLFTDGINQKRRQVADALGPPKLSLAEAQAVATAKALKDAKTSETAAVAARLAIKSDPTAVPAAGASPSFSKGRGRGAEKTGGGGGGAISSSISMGELKSFKGQSSSAKSNVIKGGGKGRVEDFVPEDDIQKISSFLDDGLNQVQESGKNIGLNYDGSSDEGEANGNPMVAAEEEDFDEKELKTIPATMRTSKSMPSNFTLESSSEEEKLQEEEEEDIDKRLSSFGNKMGFQQVFVVQNQEYKDPLGGGGDDESSDGKKKKSHHKKSKHHKKKKEKSSRQSHHVPDLEEFLSGGEPPGQSLDLSAYEAI